MHAHRLEAEGDYGVKSSNAPCRNHSRDRGSSRRVVSACPSALRELPPGLRLSAKALSYMAILRQATDLQRGYTAGVIT